MKVKLIRNGTGEVLEPRTSASTTAKFIDFDTRDNIRLIEIICDYGGSKSSLKLQVCQTLNPPKVQVEVRTDGESTSVLVHVSQDLQTQYQSLQCNSKQVERNVSVLSHFNNARISETCTAMSSNRSFYQCTITHTFETSQIEVNVADWHDDTNQSVSNEPLAMNSADFLKLLRESRAWNCKESGRGDFAVRSHRYDITSTISKSVQCHCLLLNNNGSQKCSFVLQQLDANSNLNVTNAFCSCELLRKAESFTFRSLRQCVPAHQSSEVPAFLVDSLVANANLATFRITDPNLLNSNSSWLQLAVVENWETDPLLLQPQNKSSCVFFHDYSPQRSYFLLLTDSSSRDLPSNRSVWQRLPTLLGNEYALLCNVSIAVSQCNTLHSAVLCQFANDNVHTQVHFRRRMFACWRKSHNSNDCGASVTISSRKYSSLQAMNQDTIVSHFNDAVKLLHKSWSSASRLGEIIEVLRSGDDQVLFTSGVQEPSCIAEAGIQSSPQLLPADRPTMVVVPSCNQNSAYKPGLHSALLVEYCPMHPQVNCTVEHLSLSHKGESDGFLHFDLPSKRLEYSQWSLKVAWCDLIDMFGNFVKQCDSRNAYWQARNYSAPLVAVAMVASSNAEASVSLSWRTVLVVLMVVLFVLLAISFLLLRKRKQWFPPNPRPTSRNSTISGPDWLEIEQNPMEYKEDARPVNELMRFCGNGDSLPILSSFNRNSSTTSQRLSAINVTNEAVRTASGFSVPLACNIPIVRAIGPEHSEDPRSAVYFPSVSENGALLIQAAVSRPSVQVATETPWLPFSLNSGDNILPSIQFSGDYVSVHSESLRTNSNQQPPILPARPTQQLS